jgi:exodeoxyribonuclease V alpha subunit
MTQDRAPPELELTGHIGRFIFQSDDQSYAVARFEPDGSTAEIVVAGPLHGIREHEPVLVRGAFIDHPRFGRQFKISSAELKLPSTARGIARYLERGGVKGIGKALAKRLVDAFGERTVEVLDGEPHEIKRVLGQKRGEALVRVWQERRSDRDVQIFLRGLGLGPALSLKVVRRFGPGTAAIVRADPFRLCREVAGIGFRIADRLASQVGIAKDAPSRLEAGVLHQLDQAADHGHVFLPEGDLVRLAAATLDVSLALTEDTVARLVRDQVLTRRTVGGDAAIYDPRMDHLEGAVATALATFAQGARTFGTIDIEKAISWTEGENALRLSAEQQQALKLALGRKVAIVTGGPGVGKTTFLRALVTILSRLKVPRALAAPTGRAAKRLASATGHEASTIHRLLRFDPRTRTFVHGARDPLPHSYVIIDEVSMVDLELMHALLSALAPSCTLLLVGDSDQLPSVGPGAVLRDLIASEVLPTVRLTTIFRQAAENPIVAAAHSVLRGELPRFGGQDGDGIYFLPEENAERARELIVGLCTERLPRRLGYDPLRDLQVLAPMNRGPLGVEALNAELQKQLNPAGAQVSPSRELRLGDRVLQTRNNYDLNVFNGDLGTVVAGGAGRMQVRFEDQEVTYAADEMNDLKLAYAMSVHRSQGCEFPVVILPLAMEHRVLLRRNVLYTAITRAKRLVAITGSPRALGIAVHDDSLMLRHTDLSSRLRAASGLGG